MLNDACSVDMSTVHANKMRNEIIVHESCSSGFKVVVYVRNITCCVDRKSAWLEATLNDLILHPNILMI